MCMWVPVKKQACPQRHQSTPLPSLITLVGHTLQTSFSSLPGRTDKKVD